MGRSLLLCAVLFVASAARADEIASFAPPDVTVGTEVVLSGDFSVLAATEAKLRVFGSRADAPHGVVFDVRSVSSTEIRAVARRFPGRNGSSLVGAKWSLVVVPRRGEPLVAPGVFTTVGPELIDVGATTGAPGETIELLVDDVGSGRLVVRFGDKPARWTQAASAPITLPPGVPGTLLSVIVPKLPGGPHPVSLQNEIGPSPTAIGFDVAP